MKTLNDLQKTIKLNKDGNPKNSYTAYLFNEGLNEIQKKFGEEAIELIIASSSADKKNIKYEASDVVYHLLVLLTKHDISFDDILEELQSRSNQSGIEEKQSRNDK